MVCCGSVEIEDRRIKKPYLGGWRHKISEVEYLNAESQTGPLRMPAKETCSKKVQTIVTTDVETQTPCDHPTQMSRPECFISSDSDTFLTIKPYETYEEMMQRLDYDGKARIIQRKYRVYQFLKHVKKTAKRYRELVEDCRIYREEKLIMHTKRHHREILRRMNPKSRLDFDLLYDMVEKWQRDRFDCAEKRFFKAGRCAENYAILNKAVEMLTEIDKKRQTVQARYRKRKRMRFLTIHCKPVQWHGYKNMLVEMVTMKTQKAREFNAIYNSLTNYDITLGERIEILTTLKKSLELHNCVAAFHLIRLLEQELTIVTRGMKDMPLEFLRERIVYGYLYLLRSSHSCCCANNDVDFCKNEDDEKLREPPDIQTRVCQSCLKLLPYHKFTVHGRTRRLSICVGCTWLRERNISHVNYDSYMFLLGCVRSDERMRNSHSAIAFMMQKHDIYHLVNNIWHGRSVVSENNDLFKLKMVRYVANEDWSPWNCMLLTDEEAEFHTKIEDLPEIYSIQLMKRVALYHQLAKNHFKSLIEFEEGFRDKFHKIEDKKVYKPAIKVQDYRFA